MKKTILYLAFLGFLFTGGKSLAGTHDPNAIVLDPPGDLLKGVPCLNWFSTHAGAGWRIFFQIDVHGKPFPVLKGHTLTGQEVIIPMTADEKRTVLGLAFSPKAEADLKTWIQPAYDEFLAKPEGVFGAADTFEGHLYFIAMAGQAGAGVLEKNAKTKVDQELQPHLMVYKGDSSPWIKALDVKDKNVPYFLVLNEKGEILYQTSGAYTEEKMEKISALAEG